VIGPSRPVPPTEAPKPVTAGEADVVEFTQVWNLFTGRRGYDEDEVDEFLERVAFTLAAQGRELDAARNRLETLSRQVSDVAQPSGSGWGRCL
jgi:DivIVA domain-containing protein